MFRGLVEISREVPFLLGLAYVGLCLVPSRSHLRVGGQEVVRGTLWFGKWFLIILCCVFGGSIIIDVSMTRRNLERSSFIFSFYSLYLDYRLACPAGH
jgi:hypothetical protein